MSLLTRGADLVYTFRFIKLLVTPWDETEAYSLGIIDEAGKILKKARELETSEEKSAYTYFHRLVFNIKRLLNKIPGGKTKLASYAAALLLIKEETGLSEDAIHWIFDSIEDLEFEEDLVEDYKIGAEHQLLPGEYTLKDEVPLIKTGEFVEGNNNHIVVSEAIQPHGEIFHIPVYDVIHKESKQHILITAENLQ